MYGAKLSSVIDVIPLPLPAKAHPIALDMVEHMQQVPTESRWGLKLPVQDIKLKQTYIEEEKLHFKRKT